MFLLIILKYPDVYGKEKTMVLPMKCFLKFNPDKYQPNNELICYIGKNDPDFSANYYKNFDPSKPGLYKCYIKGLYGKFI